MMLEKTDNGCPQHTMSQLPFPQSSCLAIQKWGWGNADLISLWQNLDPRFVPVYFVQDFDMSVS